MGLVKLTITISFWIFIVNGSCPFEYYQCSEFPDLCCPDGYKCTGNTSCVKNLTYPTSSSGGAIAGGILGGIVLIAAVSQRLLDQSLSSTKKPSRRKDHSQGTTTKLDTPLAANSRYCIKKHFREYNLKDDTDNGIRIMKWLGRQRNPRVITKYRTKIQSNRCNTDDRR
ncbi:unnamed protein product [Mytilus coruscus]|uniref:Granulins domain-containing protein n=1 Tax=Mytilus coruscus TaxID=42192 RepID=A0A6J7ZWN1_MYTCO|nr:unnamed protein product [Mytilus coruscus]